MYGSAHVLYGVATVVLLSSAGCLKIRFVFMASVSSSAVFKVDITDSPGSREGEVCLEKHYDIMYT